MKEKIFIMYIASILAVLIPVPGRLAYGIILAFTFIVLFFSSILLNFLLDKYIELPIKWIITPLFFVFIVTVIQCLLSIFLPVLSMQISFVLYIQVFSFYMINILKNIQGSTLKERIKSQLPQCIWYTVSALLFSLIRDILGYGTITFPSSKGLYSIKLFSVQSFPLMNFFASIPGAAILSALILLFISLVKTKKEASCE
mgnify:CR=1 FL=1